MRVRGRSTSRLACLLAVFWLTGSLAGAASMLEVEEIPAVSTARLALERAIAEEQADPTKEAALAVERARAAYHAAILAHGEEIRVYLLEQYRELEVLEAQADDDPAFAPAGFIDESEPNDSIATADLLPVADPCPAVGGRVSPSDDRDLFRIIGSTLDPIDVLRYWILVDTGSPPPQTGTTRDSVLDLMGPSGGLIESDDDDGTGNGGDALVETQLASVIASVGFFVYPDDPVVLYFGVRGFEEAGEIDPYRLYVLETSYADHESPESEPNDDPATANPMIPSLQHVGVRRASIGEPLDRDLYSFHALAGDQVFIMADGSPPNRPASNIDFRLLDRDGTTVIVTANSSTNSGGRTAEGLVYTIDQPGTYFVEAYSAGTGDYDLMIANCTSGGFCEFAGECWDPDACTDYDCVANVCDYVPDSLFCESEDNDNEGLADELPGPRPCSFVTGNLDVPWNYDWDNFRVPTSAAGRVFALSDPGSPPPHPSSLKSTVLEIFGGDGDVLEHDVSDGTASPAGGGDARAALIAGRTIVPPQYFLEVRGGTPVKPYTLTVVFTNWSDFVLEIEPNDFVPNVLTPAPGHAEVRKASLGAPGDIDSYRFRANEGDRVFIAADGAPEKKFSLGGTDVRLELISVGTGLPVAEAVVGGVTQWSAAGLVYEVTSSGDYVVKVSLGASTGPGIYDLMIANCDSWLCVSAEGCLDDNPCTDEVCDLDGSCSYPLNANPLCESEPNNVVGGADALSTFEACDSLWGAIASSGDVDHSAFSGLAGDRVWALVDTGSPPSLAGTFRDSVLDLLDPNGTTVIETDDDDGIGNGADATVESLLASVIAGRTLAASGTHYLRTRGFGTSVVDPYRVHFALTRPTDEANEAEPNDSPATANPVIPPAGQVGVRRASLGAPGDVDLYSFRANASDLLFIAADGNPERDATNTDIKLELVRSDGWTALLTANSSQNSGGFAGEGFAFRTNYKGDYFVRVTGSTPTTTGTYHLMVTDCTGSSCALDAHCDDSDACTSDRCLRGRCGNDPVNNPLCESEPNDTAAAAHNLPSLDPCAQMPGRISPLGDPDYFRLAAGADWRIWAIADTGSPPPLAGSSRDSLLDLLAADGTTVIESDDDDGTGNGGDTVVETGVASVIAGRGLAAFDDAYLRIREFGDNATIDPYRLHVAVTTPADETNEAEVNDTPATANPVIPPARKVGVRRGLLGVRGDEGEYFAFRANAGDSVIVAADGDPERNSTNLNIGLELRAPPDGSTVLVTADSSSNSGGFTGEGFAFDVQSTGTYFVRVFENTGALGNYDLMVANCTSSFCAVDTDCDDGSFCTEDTCNPSGSCAYAPSEIRGPCESESNDTPGEADFFATLDPHASLTGSVGRSGDVDYSQWPAVAGQRVWALVDTGLAPSETSRDSMLDLVAPDGATVIETDDDDGTGNGADASVESTQASIIAGRTLTASAPHFLRVTGPGEILSYTLHVVISDVSDEGFEVEGNGWVGVAEPIVPPGQRVGVKKASIESPSDQDFYSFRANPGDLVFVAADGDPERDATSTDVDFALLGPGPNAHLVTASSSQNSGGFTGEGLVFDIQSAGTYFVAVYGTGGATGTYDLLVANAASSFVCALDLDCDDFNPCTQDTCTPGTGACAHAPTGEEAAGLLFTSGTTLTWSPMPEALHYNTYRGTIPPGGLDSRNPPYDHSCFELDDSHADGALTATDTEVPVSGTAYYYLVAPVTICGEGLLGNSVPSGEPIPNTQPCP